MVVTCPACFLNYASEGSSGRCPACGAPAPPPPAAGRYAPETPGGAYGSAPGAAYGAAGPAWNAAPPPPPTTELISTTFLIMNVVLAIVCQPAGIVSFILCDQAKTLHRQGRFEEAQSKIKSARLSLWIGAVVAALLVAAYVVFVIAIIATAATRGHR